MIRRRILILGAGAWGTALGQVLADNGHDAILYDRSDAVIDDINANHRNSKYFDQVVISDKLTAKKSLSDIFNFYYPDVIVLAVPTSVMESVLKDIKPYVKDRGIFLNVAKGFDDEGETMSDLIKRYFPSYPVLSLLGPSHAEEVIIKKLTFVDVVDESNTYGCFISELFNNFYFKTSVINDMKGAELGTSFKNTIAIMSGIFCGLGFGDNARAALYTNGLGEMLKLGKALDCNIDTLLGYTGAGDLVVTCYSNNSRNFTAGLEIGKLNSFKKFAGSNTKTVEGVRTVKFIYDKMKNLNIHLPTISCLYNIIYKDIEPLYAVDNLINKQTGLYD